MINPTRWDANGRGNSRRTIYLRKGGKLEIAQQSGKPRDHADDQAVRSAQRPSSTR